MSHNSPIKVPADGFGSQVQRGSHSGAEGLVKPNALLALVSVTLSAFYLVAGTVASDAEVAYARESSACVGRQLDETMLRADTVRDTARLSLLTSAAYCAAEHIAGKFN